MRIIGLHAKDSISSGGDRLKGDLHLPNDLICSAYSSSFFVSDNEVKNTTLRQGDNKAEQQDIETLLRELVERPLFFLFFLHCNDFFWGFILKYICDRTEVFIISNDAIATPYLP